MYNKKTLPVVNELIPIVKMFFSECPSIHTDIIVETKYDYIDM